MNPIIIAKMDIYEYKYEKHREVYRENMCGLFFSHYICQVYQVNAQKFVCLF